MSRSPLISDTQRTQICTLLSTCFSCREAAEYTGSKESSIRYLAKHDVDFGEKCREAKQAAKSFAIDRIRAGAEKSSRAGVWLIDHMDGKHDPQSKRKQKAADHRALVNRLCERVLAVIPDLNTHSAVLNVLSRFADEGSTPSHTDSPADEAHDAERNRFPAAHPPKDTWHNEISNDDDEEALDDSEFDDAQGGPRSPAVPNSLSTPPPLAASAFGKSRLPDPRSLSPAQKKAICEAILREGAKIIEQKRPAAEAATNSSATPTSAESS